MKKIRTQNDKNHTFGRIFLGLASIAIISVPVVMCLMLGVTPDFSIVLASFIPLSFFIIGGIVELISYAPLLGTSATYLAHITGNMVNLKVPCAVNVRDNFGYENGSEEGEIISTVAISTSTIITTLVIAAGVIALVPLTPVLESETLAPAFSMSFTALFGALAYKYFSQGKKFIAVPMILALALHITFGLGYTILIPICALASILYAYYLFKKGKV